MRTKAEEPQALYQEGPVSTMRPGRTEI